MRMSMSMSMSMLMTMFVSMAVFMLRGMRMAVIMRCRMRMRMSVILRWWRRGMKVGDIARRCLGRRWWMEMRDVVHGRWWRWRMKMSVFMKRWRAVNVWRAFGSMRFFFVAQIHIELLSGHHTTQDWRDFNAIVFEL